MSIGYYAAADGFIEFDNSVTGAELDAACSILCDEFEFVDVYLGDVKHIDVGNYGIYNKNIDIVLSNLSKIAKIKKGNIEFRGDDYYFWRFIYKDAKWIRQEGQIVYGDMTEREKNKRRLAGILLSLDDFNNDVLCKWWCGQKCPYKDLCGDEDDCTYTAEFTVENVLEWMQDVGV